MFIHHHLVEERIEGPGEEEADPTDGHHDPHLALCQDVRVPVDVHQLHVVLHAQLRGNCDAKKISFNKTLNTYYCQALVQFSLSFHSPEIEPEEYDEVCRLFDECRLVSDLHLGF